MTTPKKTPARVRRSRKLTTFVLAVFCLLVTGAIYRLTNSPGGLAYPWATNDDVIDDDYIRVVEVEPVENAATAENSDVMSVDADDQALDDEVVDRHDLGDFKVADDVNAIPEAEHERQLRKRQVMDWMAEDVDVASTVSGFDTGSWTASDVSSSTSGSIDTEIYGDLTTVTTPSLQEDADISDQESSWWQIVEQLLGSSHDNSPTASNVSAPPDNAVASPEFPPSTNETYSLPEVTSPPEETSAGPTTAAAVDDDRPTSVPDKQHPVPFVWWNTTCWQKPESDGACDDVVLDRLRQSLFDEDTLGHLVAECSPGRWCLRDHGLTVADLDDLCNVTSLCELPTDSEDCPDLKFARHTLDLLCNVSRGPTMTSRCVTSYRMMSHVELLNAISGRNTETEDLACICATCMNDTALFARIRPWLSDADAETAVCPTDDSDGCEDYELSLQVAVDAAILGNPDAMASSTNERWRSDVTSVGILLFCMLVAGIGIILVAFGTANRMEIPAERERYSRDQVEYSVVSSTGDLFEDDDDDEDDGFSLRSMRKPYKDADLGGDGQNADASKPSTGL